MRLRNRPDVLVCLAMIVVGAMGHVETKNVRACANECLDSVSCLARGAQCCDDFRATVSQKVDFGFDRHGLESCPNLV